MRCPERDRLLQGGIITGGSSPTASPHRAGGLSPAPAGGPGPEVVSEKILGLAADGLPCQFYLGMAEAESLCGDIQKLPGCGPGQMALGVPT